MAIFYILRPKERKSLRDVHLFHEAGETSHFASAEIEIVFNNEDRRFTTIDKDKLRVSCTLGTKKDAIFLNGKSCTFEHWNNILSSAGLLRENFFAIQQGEAIRLALASPEDRLKMLESFAGTIGFEMKKKENMKLIEDSRKELNEIEENMEELNGEIDEVGKQTKSLKSYKELERKKRLISFIILDRERQKIKEKLDRISPNQSDESQNEAKDSLVFTLKKRQNLCEELQSKIHESSEERKLVEGQKTEYQNDLESRIAELHAIEERIRIVRKETEASEKNREIALDSKALIEEKIKNLQEGIDAVEEKLNAVNDHQQQIESGITERQSLLDVHYSKIGRKDLYSNPEDREKEIKKNVKDTKNALENCQSSVENLIAAIEKSQADKIKIEESLRNVEKETEGLRNEKNVLIENELKNWQSKCTAYETEDKLLQTDIIKAQEMVHRSDMGRSDSINKLRCKPHTRPLLDSVLGIEKILLHIKDGQNEVSRLTKNYSLTNFHVHLDVFALKFSKSLGEGNF